MASVQVELTNFFRRMVKFCLASATILPNSSKETRNVPSWLLIILGNNNINFSAQRCGDTCREHVRTQYQHDRQWLTRALRGKAGTSFKGRTRSIAVVPYKPCFLALDRKSMFPILMPKLRSNTFANCARFTRPTITKHEQRDVG